MRSSAISQSYIISVLFSTEPQSPRKRQKNKEKLRQFLMMRRESGEKGEKLSLAHSLVLGCTEDS